MAKHAGFINLETGVFYPNQGRGHKRNAREIIRVEHLEELFAKYADDPRYSDAEEFLIFKANFAKYGTGNQECVVIRATSPYKGKLKMILKQNNLKIPEKIFFW